MEVRILFEWVDQMPYLAAVRYAFQGLVIAKNHNEGAVTL